MSERDRPEPAPSADGAPEPGPAVAPSDTMDGQTADDELPANPFAGLLAEANAGPRAAADAKAASAKAGGDEAAGDKTAPPEAPPEPEPLDTADTVDATPDRRRVGPYRILSEIGSGGMALVHKAAQPTLDRLVAIKELRKEYVHDRQIAKRFEREATSLATLQHGNIVHVYDFIRQDDAAFIVMEFVDGIDLFDVLVKAETLPPDVAAVVAQQVAEGLEYAHYRGIVHRDIKPSNILLSRRGEVKIMDFGIARDPGKSELTQVGLAVGTPQYMAPEQIRGDKVDARTDVFSFGVLLYEMLSGDKPWPEETGRSVTVKVLDEPPVPLKKRRPDLPPALDAIVTRCIEKAPGDRYPSMFAVRRELETYLQHISRLDPRTRIVLFLKNRGFVTEAEASTFVDAALLSDPTLGRRDAGIPLPPPRLLLEPVGKAHAIGAATILVAGLFAALVPVGEALPEPGALAPAAAGAAPVGAGGSAAAADVGHLRVVVDPWARVLVDGRFVDTTPFATPLALTPGPHRISLRNPYCEPADHMVDVAAGETLELKVALIPRAPGDDGAP